MFSLKIVTRSDNLVLVRATNMRKSAYLSLGIFMTKDELDNALSPKPVDSLLSRSRLLKGYQTILNQTETQLVLQGKAAAPATEIISMIKNRIFGEEYAQQEAEKEARRRDEQLSFAPFFRKYCDSCSNEGYRTTLLYTYKILEETVGKQKLAGLKFDDINLQFLFSLEDKLMEKGYRRNSVAIHFRNLRTVINRAIDEELTDKYPFRRFKIDTEDTRKRSLTIPDLQKLFTMTVEPHQEFYRDMFKLIFMLCGINAVDLFNLKEISKEGRIDYRRAKTHKLYSIKVEPEAMELIRKYRGMNNLLTPADRWESHKEFTKWMNVTLKKIGHVERAGIGGKKVIKACWPEISTYWARHTWASVAYELDVPKDVISHALGHESGNSVTEIYIDRDIRKVDRANRLVLDRVLYGKKEKW